MVIMMAVLHVFDIMYQKVEMSYEGEEPLPRYLKMLFGFTPIKFLGWYAGILWVLFGSIGYSCAFYDTKSGIPSMFHYQYEDSPQ